MLTELTFAEAFHLVEYALIAILFYRAWHVREDGSALLLPALAGFLAGVLDEWFQWFIPIRVGKARDVALNGTAVGCGLLLAIGLEPPRRVTMTLRRDSRFAVAAWAVAVILVFGLFFQSAHLGYDIADAEIGSFRSRYTAADLLAATRERAEQWRDARRSFSVGCRGKTSI